jgi:hypothetical protein
MASPSPITYTFSSSPIITEEPRYGGFPLPPSIRLSKRSPKRHARYTNSDILLLNEARDLLKVTSYTEIWGDWQYGGRRTRSRTRINQARKRRATLMFRTPSVQPSPPTTTVAPFTAYFSCDRYEGTRHASAPDDELHTASPCERTLCRRRRKDFQKRLAGIRLKAPRPPRRLRLTMPRQPSLKLRFPANVVARNRAERLAQAALQVLSEMDAEAMRLPLKIYFPRPHSR